MSTESITKEIEKMLGSYDKDGDNKISWKEVVVRMRETGAKDPFTATYHIFSAFDKDEDGFITKSEIEVHRLKLQTEKNEKMLQKDIKKMLSQYDNNKDGKLTWDEVLAVFKADTGCENPLLTTKYLFELMDKNGDKIITKDEVRNHLENGVFGPQAGPQQ